MIVRQFERGHPKGCLLFRETYGTRENYAVHLLLTDQEKWRGYKALVKHLEDSLDLYRKGYEHSKDAGSNYYTFVKYLRRVLQRRSFPSELDLLDMEISEDHSLIAIKRKDCLSEVTSEGSQLSLFELEA